jgi:DNA-directed RNA polymerase subunit RPC12/RpoP
MEGFKCSICGNRIKDYTGICDKCLVDGKLKCPKCRDELEQIYFSDWGIGKTVIDHYKCKKCGWKSERTIQGKALMEYTLRDL